MGVVHLALSDMTKKFKELGYTKAEKSFLSCKELYKIIEEHYPDVASIYSKVTMDNVQAVMDSLGFKYRLEREVKLPKKQEPSKIVPVAKKKKDFSISNSHRRMLKLFMSKKYIEPDVKSLTGEIIRTVMETHYPELVEEVGVFTEKRCKSILKIISKVEKPRVRRQRPPKITIADDIDVTSNAFLRTWEWKTLRYEVLLEQGAKCRCCGADKSTGAIMNVDHIKPRRTHPELALDKSNLQVLCGDCNMGKGNWDTTAW